MLELIPSLLAAQTFKQAISDEVQADQTEVVVEKATISSSDPQGVASPVPSVAPPETIAAETLPTPQTTAVTPTTSNVPLREITFSRSAKPDIQTTQSEASQPATTTPSQPSQPLPTIVIKSQPTAKTQPLQTLSQPSNRASGNAIVNSSPIEVKVDANQSVEQQSNNQPATLTQPATQPTTQTITPLDQNIQLQRDQKNPTEQTVEQPGTVKPSAEVPTETQPNLKEPTKLDRPVASDRVLERKKVLEKRLAEIVSRARSKKEANLPESLVTKAYESAAQGNFEQARQSLKNPTVPAAVQAEVTKTIRSLEVNSRKIGVAQATGPIRTALKQRQMEQRQQSLLRSIPSLPPLPTQNVTVNSSAVYPFRTANPLPIQNLTQTTSANSDPDYSVTNPPNLQAFNRDLTPPDTRGSEMLYPLPTPAPVTSKYGWRVHPVRGDRRFHAGVDLGAPQGTPVLATKAGKVKVADNMGGYGLAIVLEPGQGKQDILYGHLSGMFVRPGQAVKVGTVIGRVGSTGLSTGPHLHYETRKLTASGWVTTDPGPQLQVARVQLEQALASARAASKERG
ncbi:peptidoglycan DD-metalloendopeptidase family protein [Phormidesmis priestleyi]